MGNKTEFETRNGKQDGIGERRKTGKNKKNRQKNRINRGKNRKLQEIQKEDETRFWQDKISARRDFDEILGNAENY